MEFLSSLLRTIVVSFFAICLTAGSLTVCGQNIGSIDLKSVKVDDLSDEQIANYIRQAEERGLSQSALEALARQRGVSESEIAKLRSRVASLRGEATVESGNEPEELSRTVVDDNIFGPLTGEVKLDLSSYEKRIFGYSLFNSQSLTFAPNLNLPTPSDYQLGPGDELILDLWGSTQQFFRYQVNSEGTIRPQNLGPIYVNGLTIKEAESRIIHRLSQIYSGLKSTESEKPTIFYQVSLGNIRTVSIDIIGEVNIPGVYSLPSLATVYTALHAAGGPSILGTFRDIRLVRDNKTIANIDIYSYLVDGIRSGDQRLKDGDVIIVKGYKKRVELAGEIRNDGMFELLEGETINDLFKYAGGFSNTAFKSLLTLKRNGNKEREIIDIKLDDFSNFILKDGDLIEVAAILDRFSNRVVIDGAVYREGEYQLTEGLGLKELVQRADGLRGDAFAGRATIYRTNTDFSQTTIPVDLQSILEGTKADVSLQREDVLRIPSIYDLQEENSVQIQGEVIEEGVYPFFNQMTVQDLVVLSGGLKESASGAQIEISRRNSMGGINSLAEIINFSIDKDLTLKSEDRERVLQPFDQVYIRKSPGHSIQKDVTIEGEVLLPGQYTMKTKDERVSDILMRAKGLTPYAYPKGAILIRKTEFSNAQLNRGINQNYLRQLRDKVLGDESEPKNSIQARLIERLDKIQNRVSGDFENDVMGSRLKKDLIEGIIRQDSLTNEIEIAENEPVAIDLDKIIENPGSKYDLIVKPGDIISIPGKLETVRMAGEVTSTLNVRFDKSYSFKDYIEQSGGFLQSAKRGGSYVQYPNGERVGVKRFLFFKKYPKVEPGSTIFVRKKPEKHAVNFQSIIAAVGSVATLALVIDRLSN